ncbi:MAG: type III-B CRISPR module RAMP protein Cmr4 [Chloroflexota bacterium]|nr:type III-B CRISPR module RAMP protein Cmr4 [Chloroflexota bacterium]
MTYCKHTYLWMALDPVHIGTGGYRLGRVDNSIAREPGTNLPKIPGTSLSGAARSYAAMRYEKPNCAGQGKHCGEKDCPICYTFGSLVVKDEGKTKAYAGTINIFDAQILFFPVHSMAGPVWVTSLYRLGLHKTLKIDIPELPSDKIALGSGIDAPEGHLNLGWLLLKSNGQTLELDGVPPEWADTTEWEAVKDRVVLVSDKLFGQIVNDNLEVRTSVSIDPMTGAAEEGALFTYEAMPRSTFLVGDLVQDDFRADDFQIIDTTAKENKLAKVPWKKPLDVAGAGFEMIEYLGVGGMGTRGFGRMRIVGKPLEEAF